MAQTASDAIAVLLRSGHRGPIAAVSRHGLRPRRKPAAVSGPPPDVPDRVVRPVSLFTAAHGRQASVLGLLRTLRTEVRRAEAAGQVTFEAARCKAAVCDGGALTVTLRRRGGGERRRETFDAIVNCTGPGMRPDRSANPFVASLAARGYALPHPLGIGFSVDDTCRALGAGGRADPHLRIVGPLTYGAFADQQGAVFIALRLSEIMPGIAAALGR